MFKRLVGDILHNIRTRRATYFSSETIELSLTKKNIIIIAVPTHSNIGDHLITVAEKAFIHRYFPDSNLVVLPDVSYMQKIRSIRKNLKSDDVIMLHGGGNFGTLYPLAERDRRFILNYFRKFKIIGFPQSIKYSNDYLGHIEAKMTYHVMKKVNNLTIFVREPLSFERFDKLFPDIHCIMVPDIVLSLPLHPMNSIESDHAVTLLRHDAEAALTPEDGEKMISALEEQFKEVEVTDMLSTKNSILLREEEGVVGNKVNQIGTASLVVTDRLHGMLISFLTGRQQIVFDNDNGKVYGTYKYWLSDTNTIHYLGNFDLAVFKNELSTLEVENVISNNQDVSDRLIRKFIPLASKIK